MITRKFEHVEIGSRIFNAVCEIQGGHWDGGDRSVGVNPGYEDAEVTLVSAEEWNEEADKYEPITDETLLKMVEKAVEEKIDDAILADLSAQYEPEDPFEDW